MEVVIFNNPGAGLRMRRIEDEEDMEIVHMGSGSAIKDRFRYSQKTKESKSQCTSGKILLAILIYALTTYFFVEFIVSNSENSKVEELEVEVAKVKSEEKMVINKLDNLQKELKKYSSQSRPPPAAQSGKLVGTVIEQVKPALAQTISSSVTAAPQTKDKEVWLTAELQAISEKRAQKAGRVPIAQGTVRELKLLMKDGSGRTQVVAQLRIDQVIYKDEEARKKRIQFQKQRIDFLLKHTDHESLRLVKYNMKYDDSYTEEEKKIDEQQYNRIRTIHQLDSITEEIPMCVVVPGYNNNAKFRLQYNLNSIFLQNYTNYFVVIINDASTDGSDELFRKYLDFYKIDKTKYAYVQNKVRNTALENIYIATHSYCSQDSVVLNLDGDDQFIGKNVLKIFNAGYQIKKTGVLYSNFFWYEQGGNLMYGFTSEYTQAEKNNNLYRHSPQRFSHLRSYRTSLFRRIEKKDFQDGEGKFYTSAYDMAMYFPLMELSCQRVSKIAGYHYLYNINTGLNDYQIDRSKQASIDARVRAATKYTCDQTFKNQINK